MTPRRAVLLLSAALLTGCRAPDAPLTAGDAAGCYVLKWHRGDTVYADVGLPDSVRLESAVIPGTADHRRLAFAGRAVPSDTPGPGDVLPWYREFYASHWRMGRGDSIHVLFNDNWTQYETGLRLRGGRLRGTAVFRSDYEPEPPPVISVRGTRFPCPAPP